jgi:maleamate amidohydrolase
MRVRDSGHEEDAMASEPIWNRFLTERDKAVFAASGYGARAGFGHRPAVLVVDVNYNFTGDRSEPILESIKRWRNSCGEDGWAAIPALQTLIAAARAKRVPVIYSTGTRRPDNWDAGGWAWKNARNAEDVVAPTARDTNRDGNAIVAEIAPAPQDIVIEKLKPSVFLGTPLLGFLVDLKVDSLLIVGTTTSGCVRATVIDGFSHNFRCTVVEEGCFDRSQASHAINLCDMHAKYADVVKLDEVLAHLAGLPDGLFPNLPTGVPTTRRKAAE